MGVAIQLGNANFGQLSVERAGRMLPEEKCYILLCMLKKYLLLIFFMTGHCRSTERNLLAE
jgi:hypothetical protein